ncbi:POTRA domain-containing protein [Azorhizophilus paspali]|uniref:POTRA domain-containing protein n=1 Tax=Azorhizophilus paspali TaxID=69963 RepID=UPI0036280BFC
MPLLDDLKGRDLGLAELQQAAWRLSNHYRQRGYPLAHAYLPPRRSTGASSRSPCSKAVTARSACRTARASAILSSRDRSLPWKAEPRSRARRSSAACCFAGPPASRSGPPCVPAPASAPPT